MIWTTRLRSDFGRLAAIREGSGPPLLLLHGVGLRADAWGAQLDVFAAHYEVIAPDMPGHGQSAYLPAPVTLSDYTDRIAEAMTEPALIAGHSMGALIALDLAIRFPDKCKGVAPLNAVWQRPPEAAKAVQARAAALDGSTVSDPATTLVRWFGEEASAESDACRKWLLEVDPAAYRNAYSVFAHHEDASREALAAIGCPALCITGSEEPNSTPQMSRALADCCAKGRALIIEGAAHMMPMTHADEVNAALSDFFSECLS